MAVGLLRNQANNATQVDSVRSQMMSYTHKSAMRVEKGNVTMGREERAAAGRNAGTYRLFASAYNAYD
jgi:hypothetical protein